MAVSIREEFERLLHSQQALQRRLEHLQAALRALEVLAQESEGPILQPPPMPPDMERGFTDRVRAILKANPMRTFAATEIRQVMLEDDPKADPKILLIHAHNTLKRLAKQDEVVTTEGEGGSVEYRWKMQPVVDLMAALKKSLAKPAPTESDLRIDKMVRAMIEVQNRGKK